MNTRTAIVRVSALEGSGSTPLRRVLHPLRAGGTRTPYDGGIGGAAPQLNHRAPLASSLPGEMRFDFHNRPHPGSRMFQSVRQRQKTSKARHWQDSVNSERTAGSVAAFRSFGRVETSR